MRFVLLIFPCTAIPVTEEFRLTKCPRMSNKVISCTPDKVIRCFTWTDNSFLESSADSSDSDV